MPFLIRWFALAAVLVATLTAARPKAIGPASADSLRRALNARVLEHLATSAPRARAEESAQGAASALASRSDSVAGRAESAPAARASAPGPAGVGNAAGDAMKPFDEAWRTWRELLAGNTRFAGGRPRARALVTEREALRAGQHPRAIVLGCADSRCSPELLFDQTLGDVFVVRTAGNVADPVALGSIEYAVEHLGAKLLVVLGHDGCGAVKATIDGGELPSDNLRAIVEHIAPAVNAARVQWAGDDLLPHAIAANAQQSARDMLVHGPVLRAALSRGELRIVTAVYHFDDGRVRPLD